MKKLPVNIKGFDNDKAKQKVKAKEPQIVKPDRKKKEKPQRDNEPIDTVDKDESSDKDAPKNPGKKILIVTGIIAGALAVVFIVSGALFSKAEEKIVKQIAEEYNLDEKDVWDYIEKNNIDTAKLAEEMVKRQAGGDEEGPSVVEQTQQSAGTTSFARSEDATDNEGTASFTRETEAPDIITAEEMGVEDSVNAQVTLTAGNLSLVLDGEYEIPVEPLQVKSNSSKFETNTAVSATENITIYESDEDLLSLDNLENVGADYLDACIRAASMLGGSSFQTYSISWADNIPRLSIIEVIPDGVAITECIATNHGRAVGISIVVKNKSLAEIMSTEFRDATRRRLIDFDNQLRLGDEQGRYKNGASSKERAEKINSEYGVGSNLSRDVSYMLYQYAGGKSYAELLGLNNEEFRAVISRTEKAYGVLAQAIASQAASIEYDKLFDGVKYTPTEDDIEVETKETPEETTEEISDAGTDDTTVEDADNNSNESVESTDAAENEENEENNTAAQIYTKVTKVDIGEYALLAEDKDKPMLVGFKTEAEIVSDGLEHRDVSDGIHWIKIDRAMAIGNVPMVTFIFSRNVAKVVESQAINNDNIKLITMYTDDWDLSDNQYTGDITLFKIGDEATCLAYNKDSGVSEVRTLTDEYSLIKISDGYLYRIRGAKLDTLGKSKALIQQQQTQNDTLETYNLSDAGTSNDNSGAVTLQCKDGPDTFTAEEYAYFKSLWDYTGNADEMISHHNKAELHQVYNNR